MWEGGWGEEREVREFTMRCGDAAILTEKARAAPLSTHDTSSSCSGCVVVHHSTDASELRAVTLRCGKKIDSVVAKMVASGLNKARRPVRVVGSVSTASTSYVAQPGMR